MYLLKRAVGEIARREATEPPPPKPQSSTPTGGATGKASGSSS